MANKKACFTSLMIIGVNIKETEDNYLLEEIIDFSLKSIHECDKSIVFQPAYCLFEIFKVKRTLAFKYIKELYDVILYVAA